MVSKKAMDIYGDKYDYNKSVYNGIKSQIIIICPIHGEFTTSVANHFHRGGCTKCSRIQPRQLRHDTAWFITRAKELHGTKYDYSKSVYTGIKSQIIIICSTHGEFSMTPDGHINKSSGCIACGVTKQVTARTSSTNDFISKAIKVHNNRYSYDKSEYKTCHKNIIITCQIHGDFNQTPSSHLYGSGCKQCMGDKLSILYSKNTEWFIKKSKEIHGNRYIYDGVNYKNNHTNVKIICKIHGDFEQAPSVHLLGRGCAFCAFDASSINKTLTNEDFIKKAILIHGDKYDYKKSNYISSNTKIEIICPVHGEFWQNAGSHIARSGCPKCVNRGVHQNLK